MKKIIYTLSAAILATFAFSSCEENPLPKENKVEVTGVTINTATVNLMVGETKQIDFSLTPSGANTAMLEWESSDNSIATVKSGAVTGVKNGDATIAVKAVGNDTPLATAKVVVSKYDVKTVTIEPSSLTVIIGKDVTLTATVTPDNASFKAVTWASSDEKVAEVDKNGKVSGKAEGTCKITATADGIKAECEITVIKADSFDIATDAAAGSTKIVGGDQEDIAATAENFLSYSKATQTVSWSENTTGKARSASLTLSSGSEITVSQAAITASSMKGSYNFNSKIFSKNAGKSGVTAADNGTITVEFAAPLKGETLKDVSGKTYTNTLGIKGLLGDIVVDATVIADDDKTKVGVFMDGRTAQKCAKGKDGFDYIAVLPGLGQGFISANYNFLPSPITADQDYCWIWFDLSEDGTTLRYANGNKQKLTNNNIEYYVIAISLVPCKTEEIAASNFDSAWWVVYQANPGNNVGNGLSFSKK